MRKAFRASSKQHVLFTVVAVLTLAYSAHAESSTGDGETSVSLTAGTSLPTRLNDWREEIREEDSDDIDLKEFSVFTLAASPHQGRKGAGTPFFDFSKMELGGYVGAVKYSSDFKASVGYIAAFTTYLPVPGIALGEWGLWADLYVGYVDRSLPFYYTSSSGVWFGGALGVDFTIVKGEVVWVRLQGGAIYAYWNHIDGLVNGVGGIAGVQVGFHWIRSSQQSSITFNPQLSITGKSYAIFIPVGFTVSF